MKSSILLSIVFAISATALPLKTTTKDKRDVLPFLVSVHTWRANTVDGVENVNSKAAVVVSPYVDIVNKVDPKAILGED